MVTAPTDTDDTNRRDTRMTVQPITDDTPRPPVPILTPQRGLDQAFRLAQALAQSALLPKDLRGKPNDVLVTILYGQELGLAPMQAIQGVYVVNGRPSLSAQTWVALARREGHKVKVIEETDTACAVEVRRNDDPGTPHVGRFTVDDAKRAGLLGKDTYKQYLADMLWSRAAARACRRGCPEIAFGFALDGEVDAPEPPRKATLAEVAADRDKADDDSQIHEAEVLDGPSDEELRASVTEIEREHDPRAAERDGNGWLPAAEPGSQR